MVEITYRAVWSCNNPDEKHDMGFEQEETLEELMENFTYHDHNECTPCKDYNAAFEGNIDRVEVYKDGDLIGSFEVDRNSWR